MMFQLGFAVLLVLQLVNARPQFSPLDYASATITDFENVVSDFGEYAYNFITSDGQTRGEKRTVINKGTDKEEAVVEGYFSYVGSDGKDYVVGYIADKDGYHPEGEHLVGAAGEKRRRPQVGIPANCVKSLCG